MTLGGDHTMQCTEDVLLKPMQLKNATPNKFNKIKNIHTFTQRF